VAGLDDELALGDGARGAAWLGLAVGVCLAGAGDEGEGKGEQGGRAFHRSPHSRNEPSRDRVRCAMAYPPGITRRDILRWGAAGAALAGIGCEAGPPPLTPDPPVPVPFDLAEVTLTDLAEGFRTGRHTARSLCERYLARINTTDTTGPALHAM